jgi:hypothetical protein
VLTCFQITICRVVVRKQSACTGDSLSEVYFMKVPSSVKPGVWGAFLGAIAATVVGFGVMGWKTAATSEQIAQERANTAMVTALVPYCIENAHNDPDSVKLAGFQAEHSWYTRYGLVKKAGWAPLAAGMAAPDDALVRACSDKLYEKTGRINDILLKLLG